MGLVGLPALGCPPAPNWFPPWLAYWYEGGLPCGMLAGPLGFMASEVVEADACWATLLLCGMLDCEAGGAMLPAEDEGGAVPLTGRNEGEVAAEGARLVAELVADWTDELLLERRVVPNTLLNRLWTEFEDIKMCS